NFSIRKHLIEFDDVMNKQREVIYAERKKVLEGQNLKDGILEMLQEVVWNIIYFIAPEKTYPEEWDYEELTRMLEQTFNIRYIIDKTKVDTTKLSVQILFDDIFDKIKTEYDKKESQLSSELMREIERNIVLQVVDNKWREHLY